MLLSSILMSQGKSKCTKVMVSLLIAFFQNWNLQFLNKQLNVLKRTNSIWQWSSSFYIQKISKKNSNHNNGFIDWIWLFCVWIFTAFFFKQMTYSNFLWWNYEKNIQYIVQSINALIWGLFSAASNMERCFIPNYRKYYSKLSQILSIVENWQ